MKKNLLLAVCAALVAQGVCAEPAAPVSLVNGGGAEGYSAQICAVYQNNTTGDCSATIQLRADRKPAKLKIANLKFDEKNSADARLYAYRLNIFSGNTLIRSVDMIPQGAEMRISVYNGEIIVGGPMIQQ